MNAAETTRGATEMFTRSGWCITGYHRPSSRTAGCKREFASFTCSCPCHEPGAEADLSFDSPGGTDPAAEPETEEEPHA